MGFNKFFVPFGTNSVPCMIFVLNVICISYRIFVLNVDCIPYRIFVLNVICIPLLCSINNFKVDTLSLDFNVAVHKASELLLCNSPLA